MKKVESVEEFISSAPKDIQSRLRKIRSIIKELAPQAEEKLSYGIPYYHLNGRLVYFANSKDHIGVYFPPPFVENHKSDLKEYTTSKSGIQFKNNQKLPLTLIKNLIKEQIDINKSN